MTEGRPINDPDRQAERALEDLAATGRARPQQKELDAYRNTLGWARLEDATRTPWKTYGNVAVGLYPAVIVVVMLASALADGSLLWTALVLGLGWLVLAYLRRRGIRRAMEAELAWVETLPWPVHNYFEWIALEPEHTDILIRFGTEPNRPLLEDAIRGAASTVTTVSEPTFDNQARCAIGVRILPDVQVSSTDRAPAAGYSVSHFGDAGFFRALMDTLLVAHRVTPIEEVSCTSIEAFGYEPETAAERAKYW